MSEISRALSLMEIRVGEIAEIKQQISGCNFEITKAQNQIEKMEFMKAELEYDLTNAEARIEQLKNQALDEGYSEKQVADRYRDMIIRSKKYSD